MGEKCHGTYDPSVFGADGDPAGWPGDEFKKWMAFKVLGDWCYSPSAKEGSNHKKFGCWCSYWFYSRMQPDSWEPISTKLYNCYESQGKHSADFTGDCHEHNKIGHDGIWTFLKHTPETEVYEKQYMFAYDPRLKDEHDHDDEHKNDEQKGEARDDETERTQEDQHQHASSDHFLDQYLDHYAKPHPAPEHNNTTHSSNSTHSSASSAQANPSGSGYEGTHEPDSHSNSSDANHDHDHNSADANHGHDHNSADTNTAGQDEQDGEDTNDTHDEGRRRRQLRANNDFMPEVFKKPLLTRHFDKN